MTQYFSRAELNYMIYIGEVDFSCLFFYGDLSEVGSEKVLRPGVQKDPWFSLKEIYVKEC